MNKIELLNKINDWVSLWYLLWIRYDNVEIDIKEFNINDVVHSNKLEFLSMCPECPEWQKWVRYLWEPFGISEEEIVLDTMQLLLKKQAFIFLWEDFSLIDNELNKKIDLYKEVKSIYLWEKKISDTYKYIVNITTENKKKKATVIESNPNDSVELDFDRWDRWFNTYQEAVEYANTFNS